MISAKLRQLVNQTGGSGLRAQLLRGGMGSAGIQGLSRALTLVVAIVLARMMGAEAYGIYAYAYAIMNLLLVVTEAGVPVLVMREVAAAQGRSQWGILRGAVVRARQLVFLVSAGVSVAGLVTLWLSAGSMDHSVLLTTLLMLCILPFAVLTKTYSYILRGLQHVVAGQAVEILLRPVLMLVFVGILFYISPGLRRAEYAMLSQLISFAIVLAVCLLLISRYMPKEVWASRIELRDRAWLKSAVPLILINGAAIINSQTDIIMLGWFSSSKDVGVYRVAVQGATLVTFGLQVVNAVVAPQFSRMYAQGDMKRLQKLLTLSSRMVLVASVPITLLYLVAGENILQWVFGKTFADGYLPLSILAIGQLIVTSFGSAGSLLIMTGHEKETSRVLWLTVILNIVLNSVLIPIYGSVGAAVASAFCSIMWILTLVVLVSKRLGLNSMGFMSQRP